MDYSWKVHFCVAIVISWVTLPQCKLMLIVQSYEEAPTESTARIISINISREMIQDEVSQNVKLIESKINLLQQNYNELYQQMLENLKSTELQIRNVAHEIKLKNDLLCEILNHQETTDKEVSNLRTQLSSLSLLDKKQITDKLIGIPQWVRKLKQELKQGDRNQGHEVSKMEKSYNENIKQPTTHLLNMTGIPEWVRKLKLERINKRSKFCPAKGYYFVMGVPKWVRNIKIQRLHDNCMEKQDHQTLTQFNVFTSYEIPHEGYDSYDNSYEEETDNEDSDTKTESKKSTKRKINEVFLNLMMRSKRLSWIDPERIRDNIALFIDHVTETGKLCSWAMVSRKWENLENCKEKIGMNFTMSIVVALLTTVFMVVSFFTLVYAYHQSKKAFKYASTSMSPCLYRLKDKLTATLMEEQMIKNKKIRIKTFIESTPTSYLGIITSSDAVTETAQHLFSRMIESDEKLNEMGQPVYYTVQDFLMTGSSDSTLSKYILVIDLENALQGVIFDDVSGKSCVKRKIIEQLMPISDLILLCINDPNSKQLPRGKLHNKLLVSTNDNFTLRTLCRNDKFISINKEFTPSQASTVAEWLKE